MPTEAALPLGLVLPGGGARAAYQAGALKAVAELVPAGPSPFAVISGQSAGAINAAALACRAGDFGAAVERLVSAWCALRLCDVIRTDVPSMALCAAHWAATAASGGWLVENPRSLLDNSPLAALLAREVDFDAIEAGLGRGHFSALAITASVYSGTSGQAVTFFAARPGIEEWSRSRRFALRRRLGVEHIMASAALPFLFPAQEIEGHYYGDGALRLTAPLSPAIHLGSRRLLVIAPRDPEVRRSLPTCTAPYPRLGEIAGHLLDILFNDDLDTDIERLLRVNATLELLSPEQRERTPLRPIRLLVLRPSRDLREIAARHAGTIPWTLRALLRGIGGWGGDWRLPSYLNFHRDYCRDLVALGYRDTMARRDEVAALVFGSAS